MTSIARTAFYSLSAFAITLALSNAASAQGMAMEKGGTMKMAGQYTTKTLVENEKVQVLDVVGRPGEMLPMEARGGRVFYFVSGGTFERTFADGSKQVTHRKTGETIINTETRPYSLKNVGKTTVHIISIRLK